MSTKQSKQAKAKEEQGYTKQMPHCKTCGHYRSEVYKDSNSFSEWTIEKNRRCTIGDFAVMATATCKLYVGKAR